MTKKTFTCNPVSAWIFESQCATKHKVEIVDEVGDDGVTRIKIGLKATDTSGAFSLTHGSTITKNLKPGKFFFKISRFRKCTIPVG